MDRSSGSFGGKSVNLGSSCLSKCSTVHRVIVFVANIRAFRIIGNDVMSGGSSNMNNWNNIRVSRR